MVQISAIIPRELRDLLALYARSKNMSMSECITLAVSGLVGRPDIAEIPRRPAGRPPRLPEEMTAQ